MRQLIHHIFLRLRFTHIVLVILMASSCRKFVTVDSPQHSLIDETVFAKEQTATAALLDAYVQLFHMDANPNYVCVSKASALSSDEMTLTGINETLRQVFTYSLDANQEFLNMFWAEAYAGIYKANAVISGVNKHGGSIPEINRNQIIGEAKFIRAYFYFFLVNLYGDVPLVLETGYESNSSLSRTAAAEVYKQIMQDLQDAAEMMRPEYLNGNNTPAFTRVRVNKDVATAFLARVSLYTENWSAAAEYATDIINKSDIYNLELNLDNVFSTQSKEAIMQTDDFGWNMPWDAIVYELTGDPTSELMFSFGKLSDELMQDFEPGDERRNKWVGVYSNGTTDFSYPRKYYSTGTLFQYHTSIRLAEMYLIRAEARIQLGNIADGIADLNIIRARSRAVASIEIPDPLPALNLDLSRTDAMLALEKERKLELFTEGHRWLDLKRWKGFIDPSKSRADEILPAIAATHDATWTEQAELFPLPQTELNRNKNLEQNFGY